MCLKEILCRLCPRLKIFAATEAIYGSNLTMVVFRSQEFPEKEWQHRPPFTEVVAPRGECTLALKCMANGSIMIRLILYGMLRYFLWFLMEGKWDIDVLLQHNTDLFFHTLQSSRKYSCFREAFEDPDIKGYDQYFLK